MANPEKKKAQKKQPVGINASLSRDNGSLLITCDLGGVKGQTKKGANIFALTPSPVRIAHPTIPGLTYMVKVLQRVSNDPPEVQLLKQQQADIKAKIKAYNESRKASKSKK